MGTVNMWHRGQSSIHTTSTSGGHIHDFGEGLYLADSKKVAEIYAKTRAAENGGKPRVLSVDINFNNLKILDLNKDPRWKKFINEPAIPNNPNSTPKSLIKLANENYGRMFKAFLKANKINRSQYDAVIGPEFVRGGNQMAILFHGKNKMSNKAASVVMKLYGVHNPTSKKQPKVTKPIQHQISKNTSSIKTSTFRRGVRGVVARQAGAEMLAQAACKTMEYVGDYFIDSRIEKYKANHAEAINRIHARGDGALIVIKMKEWSVADFNQNRVHNLLGVYLSSGKSRLTAISSWHDPMQPKLTEVASKGWRSYYDYIWLAPPSEDIRLPHSSVNHSF